MAEKILRILIAMSLFLFGLRGILIDLPSFYGIPSFDWLLIVFLCGAVAMGLRPLLFRRLDRAE